MRDARTGKTAWLLSSALLFSCTLLVGHAEAAPNDESGGSSIKPTEFLQARSLDTRAALASGGRSLHSTRLTSRRFATRSYGISCVPYARQVSGIMVSGNAWQWWDHASGRYARGDRPEAESVLNFRANGRMRLGHVAVVTRVVNAREVIVDHANWPNGGGEGRVSHNVAVVDVSEANNWSAVRVELSRGGEFGSVYPTYGFIYNRPDLGIVTANIARPAPQRVINSIPSDLRPVAERPWHTVEEVAEAPAGSPKRIDLRVSVAGGIR